MSSIVTRIVFVHGSVGNAQSTWSEQRALADRFECVFVTRSGYPPGPPLERIDFEEQADDVATELRWRPPVVTRTGSSAARGGTRAALASLTVSEPPAFGVARGDPRSRSSWPTSSMCRLAPGVPRVLLPLVGSAIQIPDPAPQLEQGARAAMAERLPSRRVPFDEPARRRSQLVISGGHHAAFDAVCDVIEERPAPSARCCRAPDTAAARAGLQRRARLVRRTRGMIETERLLIRPPTEDERGAMLALWRVPANERVPPDVSEEQLRTWAESVRWGVWERETEELVGDCGLFFDEGHGEWELAYGFRRDRWGRGYATEAARACVRHGFDELDLEKIVADVDPANVASVQCSRSAASKIGGEGDKLVRRHAVSSAVLDQAGCDVRRMKLERVRDLAHDHRCEIGGEHSRT